MEQAQPTQREQNNWEHFYEVLEKHTKASRLEYDGENPSQCLIGLTSLELLKAGDPCFVRAFNGDIPGIEGIESASYYENDVLALAFCYHVHPDVVNAIFLNAADEQFSKDLGDALEMAREVTERASERNLGWDEWLTFARETNSRNYEVYKEFRTYGFGNE